MNTFENMALESYPSLMPGSRQSLPPVRCPSGGESRKAPFVFVAVAASLLLIVLGTTGCQTPNVKPFHEATVEVHSAVRQAYHTTWSQLDAYEAVNAEGSRLERSAAGHPANRFAKGWAMRLKVMAAMVSYSESLANIVKSGEESQANAKAISDQVAKLVESTPWGVYGDAAKSIFQQVHGLAVSVAQSHSIAKAVGKADEPVQRVAEAMGKDLESLEVVLQVLHEDQLASVGAKYNDHRAYVNEVSASRLDFEQRLLKLRKTADGPRLKLLEARASLSSGLTHEELQKAQEKVDTLTKKLDVAKADKNLAEDALKECDELLARVAATESAYQAEMKAAQETRQASLELVKGTSEAIRFWAAAHTDLKAAIEEHRSPNVSLLISSGLEIRETIRKLKSHE